MPLISSKSSSRFLRLRRYSNKSWQTNLMKLILFIFLEVWSIILKLKRCLVTSQRYHMNSKYYYAICFRRWYLCTIRLGTRFASPLKFSISKDSGCHATSQIASYNHNRERYRRALKNTLTFLWFSFDCWSLIYLF